MPTKTLDDLDRDLTEIIQAVEQAANWGMAHRDDKEASEKTLHDCEEMLEVVMDASILEN
jgi:hypothetical protein